MAKRPVADFLRFLSAKHGVVISYDVFYRSVLSGLIPASRNDRGTRWEIDDADEPAIVRALDIASMPPVPNKGQKPAPSRPARSRATRPAA
jgi:hypothetical protein